MTILQNQIGILWNCHAFRQLFEPILISRHSVLMYFSIVIPHFQFWALVCVPTGFVKAIRFISSIGWLLHAVYCSLLAKSLQHVCFRNIIGVVSKQHYILKSAWLHLRALTFAVVFQVLHLQLSNFEYLASWILSKHLRLICGRLYYFCEPRFCYSLKHDFRELSVELLNKLRLCWLFELRYISC